MGWGEETDGAGTQDTAMTLLDPMALLTHHASCLSPNAMRAPGSTPCTFRCLLQSSSFRSSSSSQFLQC